MTYGTDGIVRCKCGELVDTNWPGHWNTEKDCCKACGEEEDE